MMRLNYILITLIFSLSSAIALAEPAPIKKTIMEKIPLAQPALQPIRNFQRLGQLLKERKQLLILEFSAQECPFCERLENNFLQPMLTDPRYQDKVIIRKIDIDSSDSIVDYDGSIISADILNDRYDGRFTPTMVFLDHEGRQVGLKIIGLNGVDFFSVYLDEEIERGLVAIRGKQDKPHLSPAL